MNQRKRRNCFFESFLVAVALLLAAQTLLSFPFEAFAKKTTTGSSESIYLLDNKTSTSLTDKGVNGPKEGIKLQREQSKIENDDSSDPKESSKKESVKEESEKASSKNEISPFAVGTATDIDVGGIKYTVWPDGKAGVRGFYGSSFENVTIPATVSHAGDIYSVVHIYYQAFKDNFTIKKLSFASGSNLTMIEDGAFYECNNLQSVDFTNCNKLNLIQKNAFHGCGNLSSLKFPNPSSLRTIGETAFYDCAGLTTSILKIPESVRTIEYGAFAVPNKYYSEVHHKKIASVTGELPSLQVSSIDVPEEAKNYESKVDSSQDKTLLHKAAKWTNDERTTAEIRLDYGYNFDRLANLDVVFVMDYSGSMTAPATTKDEQGITHSYPRGFLTNDIVYDASKMLIDSTIPGYDNQVAMVGFEGLNEPLFRSNGFTKNTEVVKDFLIKHPNITTGQTNYNAGLQGAIDILDQHSSNERMPVVIFLSDGLPYPEEFTGISQANTLRSMGVNVYPIAIYTKDNNTSTQALKNISYDRQTAYVAEDTDSFERIMKEVLYDVINHAEPLEVQIEDVLSEEFELLSGGQADFELSPDGGQVRVDGQKLTWDLRGCEQGVAHTLKIKVKVKEGTELTATGILDTNDSMGATDGSIESNEQPKLERYLAHYRFENATHPNVDLPKEIKDLLPKSTGGYGNNRNVVANDTVPNEVKTADGRAWAFLGWDENDKTINGADVTFVGRWQFKGYDFSFIKFNDSKQGLAGAEFSLYAWKGANDPSESDLVNQESIAGGKWELLDTQTSQDNGRVDFYVPHDDEEGEEIKHFQIVETKAPDRYAKPQGQWRFTLDENGYIANNALTGIGGQNNSLPPPFELIEEGEFNGLLGVINKPAGGYLPATGGFGQHAAFTMKAIAFWLIGLLFVGTYLYINRKKERVNSRKK
ncbi:leucine-rich repeat protein [Enterococcus sp. DIV0756]|uniref:leucine-rich repeat protein n=1 Tax=Enterococcus sp. DIV0756 TaxID=2774636 RepID=UPI003F1F2600